MDLRLRSCRVELSGRGWRSSPRAVADGSGQGSAALGSALQALRLTDIDDLPTVARLTVADEYVYYTLLEADLTPVQARAQARERLCDTLQRGDLRVQVMPLGRPSGPGRRWLAAAVAESDLQAWEATLRQVGVRLTHLHTALIEDLRGLAGSIPEDDAVIALLREEGVSLVRLRDGLPVALAWERYDDDLPQSLEERLRGFVRAAAAAAGVGHQCVIYLLPESRALCRYVWDGRDLPGLFPRPLEGIGTRWMRHPTGFERPDPRMAPRPTRLQAADPSRSTTSLATATGTNPAPARVRDSAPATDSAAAAGAPVAGLPLPEVVEWHGGTAWPRASQGPLP